VISIVDFAEKYSAAWDNLVLNKSANGTLFHTRHFLSYHNEEAFLDRSIMLFRGDQLVSVLAVAELENGSFFSHPGTSCGGPVIHRDHFKVSEMIEIFAAIDEKYRKSLGMRICEDSLIDQSNALLLYHFASNLSVHIEISSYKELNAPDLVGSIYRSSTRSAVRAVFRQHDRFKIAETVNEYSNFYAILKENLGKHNVSPTHTRDEFLSLKNLLNEDQKLVICLEKDGTIACGVWIIRASPTAWHAQYIAKNYDTEIAGVVEAALIKCMEIARDLNARNFSLGISTEDQGARLNLGLISFKEKLGCKLQNRYLLLPKA